MSRTPINEYIQTAKNITKRNGGNFPHILGKILLCRLVYGLGPKHFVLYNLYEKPLSQSKQYMTKTELEAFQEKVNSEGPRVYADDKLAFYLKCRDHGLPTPEILGVIDKSNSIDENVIFKIKSGGDISTVLENSGDGKYIFKPKDGSFGSGMMLINYIENQLFDERNQETKAQLVFESLMKEHPTFILQKYLAPHPSLSHLMPLGGMGTARIMTVNHDGNIKVLFAAVVKFPTGSNFVDNFSNGATKNIMSGIDFETSKLMTPYGPDKQGLNLIEKVELHPDTNQKIEGIVYPFWQEMIDIAIKGAKAFSELYTIGWDVALTSSGPALIEANWRYDVEGIQTVYNRGLKKEFIQFIQT